MKKEMAVVLMCIVAASSASQAQGQSLTDLRQLQFLSVGPPIAASSPLSRSGASEAARLANSVGGRANQTQTQKNNVGHPVLKGTLIGAAIGGGFVALTCHAGSENECPYLFWGGVFGGAGIGAAVGAVIAIARR